MIGSIEVLLGYLPWMSYKNNCDLQSKSRTADENPAKLHNLMKELKTNLTELQELQVLYHSKHIKKCSYSPGDSVYLSGKNIKTKKKFNLEHKYLGPFEILEAVGKQAYKIKVSSNWHIHPVFHISLLEGAVTRKEGVDQKMANKLEFEEGEVLDQEVDSIIDRMVFTQQTIDDQLPRFYYLIYWKRETYAEDTWKPVEGIAHLQPLLKKYHTKNHDNPVVISPPFGKGAPPLSMVTQSGAKTALSTPTLIRFPLCNRSSTTKA